MFVAKNYLEYIYLLEHRCWLFGVDAVDIAILILIYFRWYCYRYSIIYNVYSSLLVPTIPVTPASIVGVDLSKEMVDYANEAYR